MHLLVSVYLLTRRMCCERAIGVSVEDDCGIQRHKGTQITTVSVWQQNVLEYVHKNKEKHK